jgi:2-polyprenyl-6-methoxyphenol hydroxylase-like FAD-dependent oxidoreductase
LLAASDAELARAVELASMGMLGRLEPVSVAAGFSLRRMRAARLIAPRLALVGDTAHNVHPLAGQGLNLGFGDAEVLAAVLAARGMESDSGAYSLLRRFERSRREDLLAMEAVTDGLQVLFDGNLPGVRRLRNAALRLANRFSPIKRLLVKRAMG